MMLLPGNTACRRNAAHTFLGGHGSGVESDRILRFFFGPGPRVNFYFREWFVVCVVCILPGL